MCLIVQFLFYISWEQRKLGEIANIQKGQQLGKAEMSSTGTYYVLNGGMEASGFTNQYNTLANTISISEGGNSCGYVSLNLEHFWSGGHNYTLQNLKINTIFLYQWLKRQEKRIMALRVGSGLPNIQKSSLQDVYVKYSTTTEQQAIALFLIKIDNLITLHQRKQIKQNLGVLPEKCCTKITNSWEQRKFKESVEIERGGSPRPINDYITNEPNGLNWIKIGDAPEQGNVIVKTAEKIKPSGLSKTRQVQIGDLILSNSMSFGKPYIMGINGCIHDGWLLIRDVQGAFDLIFLCQLLGTDQMLKQYKARAAGSTVNNLNKELVGNTLITVPTKCEQHKLGGLFQKLDDLITLHQCKYFNPFSNFSSHLVCFEKYKKANSWEQRKFKESVEIERGGSPRPINDYITNEPNGLNWIKIGDAPEQGNVIVKTAEKIKPSGLSKTRQVQIGDLILSNSMSFGKPYIMGINGCIHDGWLLIRDVQGAFDLIFLCQLLGTDQMLKQYKARAAGSTVNNLNKELVGNTLITVPTKCEQHKLGGLFQKLDDLITLHQRKLKDFHGGFL